MTSPALFLRLLRHPSLRPVTAYSLATTPTSQFPSRAPEPPPQSSPEPDSKAVFEKLRLKANDWKAAFDYFHSVEIQHTTENFNCMIDILGKFFEFELCWKLIESMPDCGAMPDHATFRALFKRYVSAHLVEEAIAAYERSNEFNLRDETCYSYLVDAMCEYKHVVEAEEFVFQRKPNDEIAVGMMNSTKVHNLMLRGWFKMKWWGKCRDFWEEMDKKGVQKDLRSYSIYMDIMCKSGKAYKAVKLYKEMKAKGIRLDVVAYNTVILAIGQSMGVDFATRVYREMREMGCKPNVVTCNTVIKLLCENSRMEEANEMLENMSKEGIQPDVITYHSFYRCLGDPKKILRLFDSMIEDGVQPTMSTFVMLIRKFGRWGFLRPASIVWSKMIELGYSPDESAYNAWIDVLIDKGLLDEARKYDAEMFEKGLSAKPRKEFGTGPVEG
ncbi:unnamed protein product [Linum tenue]|uniref:Pentatricopeptide repeat-containing protein n=3 Tax=Linum tenue TaxID=586396 RepID=A0AAV0KQH7_9ROSI|nr:unnamed protein product [Linum tenue]